MAEVIQPLWLRSEEVYGLPKEWKALPTEDVCIQLKPGKLFDKKTAKQSGSVPILSQGESGYIGFHDEDPGVLACPENPVVTFANHTCAMRLMKQPFSCIQNIFPKVGKPGITDTVYFYYACLGRVRFTDYKGHHPLFRKAIIPVPPLPIQKRIAGILSAYDELIENNQRRIRILEEMARSLYREWFVHFRYPGHENIPLVDSPLGPIPQGWEVVPLGKLTKLIKERYKENEHSELPLLDLKKMLQRTLSVGDTGSPDELTTSRIIFNEGDILFGSIRPYLHKVALAPFKGVTNVSVFVIRPRVDQLRSFLAVLLSSDGVVKWADQHSSGTKMPVIKWDVFSTLPVIKPDNDTLLRYDAIVAPMLQCIKRASKRVQILKETRDLLLPKLISGEVNMSDLEGAA